jgi:hypothetical protein
MLVLTRFDMRVFFSVGLKLLAVASAPRNTVRLFPNLNLTFLILLCHYFEDTVLACVSEYLMSSQMTMNSACAQREAALSGQIAEG